MEKEIIENFNKEKQELSEILTPFLDEYCFLKIKMKQLLSKPATPNTNAQYSELKNYLELKAADIFDILRDK